MKIPEVETAPPEADQLTAVFWVPDTVAVNCTVAPEGTVAELGEIETIAAAAETVTMADADFVGSAALVAVTVKTVFELT